MIYELVVRTVLLCYAIRFKKIIEFNKTTIKIKKTRSIMVLIVLLMFDIIFINVCYSYAIEASLCAYAL